MRFLDSRLVANQINGFFQDNEAHSVKYLEKVRKLINIFKFFTYPRFLDQGTKKQMPLVSWLR